MGKGKGKKFAFLVTLNHLLRWLQRNKNDASMSITDVLLILLAIIIFILFLIGLYWFLRTYFAEIKAYFQRKFSRSPRQPTTAGHEIVGTPILVSHNLKEAEDVEISLKSSRLNSNVTPKMIKTNEFESDSAFESNLDFGNSPINLKDPPIGHPPI